MRYRQREIKRVVVDFVLLKFYFEKGESVLKDDDIQLIMLKKWLRPVTENEWVYFTSSSFVPNVPIAAFGKRARSSKDSGWFTGVSYLDIAGNVKVIENWKRGSTGDQWDGEWEFLFSPPDTGQ